MTSSSQRRADGRLMEYLKSFVFVGYPFWASPSQKLSQSMVWASILPKKYSFGSEADPNPKFWVLTVLVKGVVGNIFSPKS
jgi:hypothetical protein